MMMRLLPLIALGTLLTVSGCSVDAAEEEEGDVGESSGDALTERCSLSRSEILASVSGGRERAIERGFRWLDRGVSYSQGRSFEGYRTDCSGFVSMCWELGQSYTTASFENGSAPVSELRSYDSLLPGDALVRRSRGSGHIVLFLGWNDNGSACVLEQNSTRLDMEFGARSRGSLQAGGYDPIRADKF